MLFRSKIITGHKFSPELWFRLFGPVKYNKMFLDPEATLSLPLRRRIESHTRRDVPDSTISAACTENGRMGVVEHESAVMPNDKETEILMDMEEMLSLERSAEETAQRLGCDVDEVEHYNERAEEFAQNLRKFWDD